MHGSSTSGAHSNESHFFVYSASQHSTRRVMGLLPCLPSPSPKFILQHAHLIWGLAQFRSRNWRTKRPTTDTTKRGREDGGMEGLVCIDVCNVALLPRVRLEPLPTYRVLLLLRNGLKSGSKVARIVCIILTWCCHSKCVHFYPSLVVYITQLIP